MLAVQHPYQRLIRNHAGNSLDILSVILDTVLQRTFLAPNSALRDRSLETQEDLMSPSNTGRTVRTAAIVAVGALILSACGNGAEADNDEVRQVSVGMMPIATSVAL